MKRILLPEAAGMLIALSQQAAPMPGINMKGMT
jgi:hypothetical protein